MANLQGVWRVDSVSLQGNTVFSNQTHLVVTTTGWREVWDRTLHSDEPRPETSFRIEGDKLHLATTWHQPDGTVQGPFEGTWVFELDGDELRTCAAGYDLVPTKVDDTEGTVTTYSRVTDIAEIQRVSAPPVFVDKPTRLHPVLGELRWDANLSWFKSADGLISLIVPFDAPLDAHVARAIALRDGEQRLKEAAAAHLLDLHNTSWREDAGEETAAGFARRLVLDGITVDEDLAATAYFEDGDLFGGHVVIVAIDAEGEPTDASIAG